MLVRRSFTCNLLVQCVILLIGTGTLLGYHIGVLNIPVHHIKDFYNATYTERGSGMSTTLWSLLWSVTSMIYYPGCVIGSLASSRIAKRYGRKMSIIYSLVPQIAGSVIQTICVVCKSPELLIIGRFICGFSGGVATSVAPMYISEISPMRIRGTLVASFQLSVTIGLVISSILGISQLLGSSSLWIYLLLVPTLLALVTLVALIFSPDSPRHLMIDLKDQSSAEKAVKHFLKEKEVEEYMEEMRQEASMVKSSSDKAYTFCMVAKEKQLRKPMLITVILPTACMFTGAIAVFSYSAEIFENAGVKSDLIQFAVIVQNLVNCLTTVFAGPLMDRIGRKPLCLVALICIIVDLAVLTTVINLKDVYHWVNYLSVMCIGIFVMCYAILASVPWVLCSELFLQGPRDIAMSMFGTILWSLAAVVGILFVFLVQLLNEYVFLVFMAVTIMCTIFVFLKVPETKNKSFQEIAKGFGTD